ncbi:hypothetical protein [Actinomycetospora termitidis]|uniref:Secreted protein n=1 Tax=Actinomycetospora termitidis TaxID=3053470 RepID=A0ABT7M4V7_9PSEU|nr:hypothetical protein [Actinomycetospora sp. Odt1-22]MDL5155583.1 hypothetical protein [Actinomycetospora sp. Odt1-22]
MQMFRKAAVATVILGAGLASTAGVAMAHEHHGDAGKSCSNAAAAKSSNGADKTLGDTTGGDQDFALDNTCDILNGNEILSDNNAATAGTITNGDTTTVDETSTDTSSSSIVTTLTGLLG